MPRTSTRQFDKETKNQLTGMSEAAHRTYSKYKDYFIKKEMIFNAYKADSFTKVCIYWQGDLTALECSYCKAASIQLLDYQVSAVRYAIFTEFLKKEESKWAN